MSIASSESGRSPGMKFYVILWLGLLCIVAVEVMLTYAGLSERSLVIALLALAVIEAAVALMYFMQLKYERPILFWSLIPTLVFVLVLFNHLWPDAFRLTSMRLPAATSSAPRGTP